MKKLVSINFKIEPDLFKRLRKAVDTGPYKTTATAIVKRGIELALAEMGKKK